MQARQLRDEVWRQQIGAGAQQLSQFDKGGTELFQCLAEVLWRGMGFSAGAWTRSQPPTFDGQHGDGRAEAVSHKDAQDVLITAQLSDASGQGQTDHGAFLMM